MLRLAAALFAILSFAGAAAAQPNPDIAAARKFQQALKANDRTAVARMVDYPVSRDFPLPPVRSAKDFTARWDEFFDKAGTAALLKGNPEEVGWRGVMLANGIAWFNNGRMTASNLGTQIYRDRLASARRQDMAMLYPGARGYTDVPVHCSTKSKQVRIQMHGDKVRYFAWPKGVSVAQRPEIELAGTSETQGSAGNMLYSFSNKGYRYELYAPRICEAAHCEPSLTVYRGDKQIFEQACR